MPDLGFTHRFVPAADANESRTLLLLHGTGGDEDSLLPLGDTLLPGAAILSPRGRISENGMPRFFRRFAEGVFDLENLREETHGLADFVLAASKEYRFDVEKVVAIGFSNGANIASTQMLLRPETLGEAILIRTMVTLEKVDPMPDLHGKRLFISSGRFDPMVPVDNVDRLAETFRLAGANVTHHWVEAGHNLTHSELVAMRDWLTGVS